MDQICLEEDSCRHGENKDEYLLDRLGIPLLEVTTKPQLKKPKDVQEAARGWFFRFSIGFDALLRTVSGSVTSHLERSLPESIASSIGRILSREIWAI